MVATGVSVACGFHLSGGAGYGLVVIPALLTALITGLGNLINDYYDTDTDRINRPGRPIPSGRLTRTYVYRLYWTGTVVVTVSMVGVLPAGLWQLMLGWEVLLFLYAYGGKRVPVLGNLVVGAIVSSTFLAGAMLNQRILAVGFPVAFAFLLVLGRELIKGAEDVRGDRLAGASTAAVRFGVEKTLAWAVVPLLLCVLAAPLPGLMRHYSRAYVLMIELTCVPGILLAVYTILQSPAPPALRRASRLLKVGMFFGIAALVVA